MRFKQESEDLKHVKEIADKWGYGNLIQFLKQKWADKQVSEDGVPERAAALAAGMDEDEMDRYSSGFRYTE